MTTCFGLSTFFRPSSGHTFSHEEIDNVFIKSYTCLLKQVIEGKVKGETEVTRRRGRRRKKLLDDLKDGRGYCHLKEEALDRTIWRNRFGRGVGPVVRQTAE
jgi:hypothetical protein